MMDNSWKLGICGLALLALTACEGGLSQVKRPDWPVLDRFGKTSAPEETTAVGAEDESSAAGEDAEVAPISAIGPKGELGKTVVSLGTATESGLWLKTPLAKVPGPGRVRYGGKSVEVTLIPLVAEDTAGSRLSLQAMQALGIPLTDLAEVSVSGS